MFKLVGSIARRLPGADIDTGTSSALDPIVTHIQEAAAWCAPRIDLKRPSTCLRSPEFGSPELAHPLSEVEDQAAVVEALALRRRELLRAGGTVCTPVTPPSPGRLLVYAPGDTYYCGNTEFVTSGFFDGADAPPWDTWVCLLEGWHTLASRRTSAGVWCRRETYLLSWVPAAFTPLADKGVPLTVAGCLFWADSPGLGTQEDAAFGELTAALGVGYEGGPA